MKTRILFALFVSPVALARATTAPIYEENFNTPGANIKYTNGADLGASGSGVSENLADRAYVGAPASTQNERNGPACLALKPIAPNPLSAFTCTFWYYLDEQGPVLQVPLSTAGVLFLMHDKGFEVRIENQLEAPRSYVFSPGINGPYASWRARGRWIFAAFAWNQATNTFSVYQATPKDPVAFMRDMTGPVPARPSLPRADATRDPEVIGNTFRTLDRPLAGRLDNLRFYDRVVLQPELEIIRQADLANEQLKQK